MKADLKRTVVTLVEGSPLSEVLAGVYRLSGRKPWSTGYALARNRFIEGVLSDGPLMEAFRSAGPLPAGYGVGLDERVIEYPFALSQLREGDQQVFDAGSALNYGFLIDSAQLKARSLLVATLAPETRRYNDRGVSYLYGDYGDLRTLPVKDRCFDAVVCCSVLEHVGMDNTLYERDERRREDRDQDYLLAVQELSRVTKASGRLVFTVPFGKALKRGWMQQFDAAMVKRVTGMLVDASVSYYRYADGGWQIASCEACGDAEYFDIHAWDGTSPIPSAAAGAVACISGAPALK